MELSVVEGKPESVLVKEAQGAVLLVLDSPRPSKLNGGRARRTASHVIFKSPCPVAVMPVPTQATDPDVQQARVESDDEAIEAAQTATGPAGPIKT